jgi:hypothetical protein
MYPQQDDLADFLTVQAPRDTSWVAFFYHLPELLTDAATLGNCRVAFHNAFCRCLAWTSPTVPAPTLGDETLGMLFSNILLLLHHYVKVAAANNHLQALNLCNKWLATKHRNTLKHKLEQLKKDPTSSQRLNQWFGALVQLFSRFSPQEVQTDSSHVPLTQALVYDSPPWVLVDLRPATLETAAKAPAQAATEGAAERVISDGQMLRVVFPSNDYATLVVSYTAMTVEELISIIRGKIQADACWTEMSQQGADTPQELRGLFLAGKPFLPGGSTGAKLLCELGLRKECSIRVLMKNRLDNSKSPESRHAASSSTPLSTTNASRGRHSTSWELPRGPPMYDSSGAPLHDGNGEQIFVGDMVVFPHGSMDGQTMGIALFSIFSNDVQTVRVRSHANHSHATPNSLSVLSSRSTTPGHDTITLKPPDLPLRDSLKDLVLCGLQRPLFLNCLVEQSLPQKHRLFIGSAPSKGRVTGILIAAGGNALITLEFTGYQDNFASLQRPGVVTTPLMVACCLVTAPPQPKCCHS